MTRTVFAGRISKEEMIEEARDLASSKPVPKRVYLEGPLGTGKSTFARAFMRKLGVEGAIPSPTFVIRADYQVGCRSIHHVDMYRLSGDPLELCGLGVDELLESDDIVVVEWAERLPPHWRRLGATVEIGFCGDPDSREVRIAREDLAGN
ncbi:tRNA (adenosine(37)-N6)-threonylcarbamoyltransferase complex ATPase subunit type 1 TsaE [Candidatus Fermentibacteria bacterium]|nr:tRNA (adenosine(37)-N6)-threonylcarbamoyltransferase complex ATPase subunit type 1 TsaE [Candidatus Fermentibacteria bacterium]